MNFVKWKVALIAGVVLSLIVMIVCGFSMPDEIKPGDGFSLSSMTVEVPADNINWTDSGVSISSGKKFEFTVNGSAFFCSETDQISKMKSSVIKSNPIGVRANNKDYVSAGLKVSTGDIIRFGLVQNKRKIQSCAVINGTGETKLIYLDKDNTFYDSNGKPLLQKDACRGGNMYDSSKKLLTVLPSYESAEVEKYIANNSTEKENKWIRGEAATRPPGFDFNGWYRQNWIQGAFGDLRVLIPNSEKISNLNCNVNTTSDGVSATFKQYESSILNDHCKKFARNGQGGNVLSYFVKTEKKTSNGVTYESPVLDSNNQTFEIAEGLVAGYGKKVTDTAVMTIVDKPIIQSVKTCRPYKEACRPYIEKLQSNLNLDTCSSNKCGASSVSACRSEDLCGIRHINPLPQQYQTSFLRVDNLSGKETLIAQCEAFFGNCDNTSCINDFTHVYGSFKVMRSGTIGNPNREFGLYIKQNSIVGGVNIEVNNVENVSELGSSINYVFPGFLMHDMKNGCYEQISQETVIVPTPVTTIVPVVTFEDCFPKDSGSNSNCKTTPNYSNAAGIEKSSLRLNYDYRVGKQGILENELFLSIANEDNRYANSVGGYNVEILKSCPRQNAEDLYYYIDTGNGIPSNGVNSPNVRKVKDIQQGENFAINSSVESGKLYFMIADPKKPYPYDSNTHGENMGEYKISFTVNSVPTWVSEAVSVLVTPLKTLIMGAPNPNAGQTGPTSGISFDMYHSILDSGLRTFARLLMVMFVTVIGLGFVLGIIELKTTELFIIIFKIGAVAALLTNTSWEFFNRYLLNIFWYGADDIIIKFMDFYNGNSSYSYNASFAFLNKTVGTMLQWENIVRAFSLLAFGFVNPLSWFLFIQIMLGLWNVLQAAFKGIILYCVCLVINGFLVALAPIFICFLLFKQTFRFFDTWIKQLISNMFILTFYFLAIGMLNEIIFFMIYKVLNYGVYSKCMLAVNIDPLKLCLLQFPMPFPVSAMTEMSASGAQIENGLPISFMDVIIFYIVCRVSNILIDICIQLAQMFSGASMVFSSATVMKHAVEAGKYTIGMDRESVERRKRAVKGLPKKQVSKAPRTLKTPETSTDQADGNGAGGAGQNASGGLPGIGAGAGGGVGAMPGIGTGVGSGMASSSSVQSSSKANSSSSGINNSSSSSNSEE